MRVLRPQRTVLESLQHEELATRENASIGIDFGTTTTEFALHQGDQVKLLKDAAGDTVIPSYAAFLPSGRVCTGRLAKARAITDEKNTLHSVKRIIGLPWLAEPVREYRRLYPFELEEGPDEIPRYVTRTGKITAVQAAGHMIAGLREAEGVDFSAVDGVMVTMPPSFSPRQHMAILQAAEAAGFEKISLIDESYVAALPFLTGGVQQRTIAVYDLGGGTLDIAVLRCRGLSHRLLAFGGDPYLGGDDIDMQLATWVAQQVLEEHRWDLRTSKSVFSSLVQACERVKVRLSDLDQTQVWLAPLDTNLAGKHLTVHREQLDGVCHELMQRSFVVCDDVLKKAGIPASKIDAVVLAGGSTRMPLVRKAVSSYFGCEVECGLPPEGLVATGAALAAGLTRRGVAPRNLE